MSSDFPANACYGNTALAVQPAMPLTVAQAAEAFAAHKVSRGKWGPSSLTRNRICLKRFTAIGPDVPVQEVDVGYVERYMEAMATAGGMAGAGLRLATQRGEYALVSEFLEWCRCRRLLAANPCRDVLTADRPWLGKRAAREIGRGKTQLRNADEASAYLAQAARLTTAADRVGAVLPLLCQLRAGEVCHLQVADVDWTAGVLWIRDDEVEAGHRPTAWCVKTASSQDTVPLPTEPAWLARDLRELCADQKPTAYVLRPAWKRKRDSGQPWGEDRLWRLVRKVCTAADVALTGPHGLRGTGASILTALGKLSRPEVAAILRHADVGTATTLTRAYDGAPLRRTALRVVGG